MPEFYLILLLRIALGCLTTCQQMRRSSRTLFWKELSWKFRTVQQLTAEEIICAQCFEFPATAIATAEAIAQEESVSFVETALNRRRTAAPALASSHRAGRAGRSGGRRVCDVPVQPQYQPLHFIPPTSNICERFFSLAKLVYSDLRKDMKCTTLEIYCFFAWLTIYGIWKWYRSWLETRVMVPILTMFLMRSSLDITLTLILKSTLAHSTLHACINYNE